MIRPAAFGSNDETAASNRFQADAAPGEGRAQILASARAEFERLAAALREAGTSVCVVDDTAPPQRPDAVFPNNWISFHADGTVVLYPMLAPNRRLERRDDVPVHVSRELGFRVRRCIDLTAHEQRGRFLEGTGSLVLDHVGRIALACRSPRTDAQLVTEWCRQMDYEPVIFDALDAHGVPYYHTNVMMWIGGRIAAVATEAIAPAQRAQVLRRLSGQGRELIELDRAQVMAFAGNMLELRQGLVMSATAEQSLPDAVRRMLLARTARIISVPVPTIERVGGGSVRCMLAEVPDQVNA